MAKDKESVKITAESAPETAVSEPKFKLEKLRVNYQQLFGVSETIFIGATAGLAGDKEYSVSEIKASIERWKKKEAK